MKDDSTKAYYSIFGYIYEFGFCAGFYKKLKEKLINVHGAEKIFPIYDDMYRRLKRTSLLQFFQDSYLSATGKRLSPSVRRNTLDRIDRIIFMSTHAGYAAGNDFLSSAPCRNSLKFLSMTPYVAESLGLSAGKRRELYFSRILKPQFSAEEAAAMVSETHAQAGETSTKGVFINSDLIVHLDDSIFVVDLSSYVGYLVSEEENGLEETMKDTRNGLCERNDLGKILEDEDFGRINFVEDTLFISGKLMKKSIISRLNISNRDIGFIENEKMKNFMSFVGTTDKETYKLLQAASYGFSYVSALEKIRSEKYSPNITVSAAGWSNIGYSSMNILWENDSQRKILCECFRAYRGNRNADALDARRGVLSNTCEALGKICPDIRKKAAEIRDSLRTAIEKTYVDGKTRNVSRAPLEKKVVDHLKLSDCLSEAEFEKHRCVMETYFDLRAKAGMRYGGHSSFNTDGASKYGTYRDLHAAYVVKALLDDRIKEIFLMGCPGVGKTTAVVEYLKSIEGIFCFIYASSRIQVSNDAKEKLRAKGSERLFADNLVTVTTNSTLREICDQSSKKRYEGAVEYEANDTETLLKIVESGGTKAEWLTSAQVAEREASISRVKGPTRHESVGNNRSREKTKRVTGVMETFAKSVGTIFEGNLRNENNPFSVAGVLSLQSLQKSCGGKTTMRHLVEIFAPFIGASKAPRASATVERKNIPRHLKPVFVFMIDEITGADCGLHFRNELEKFISQNNLREYLTIKVVVADASLVSKSALDACIESGSKIGSVTESRVFVENIDLESVGQSVHYEENEDEKKGGVRAFLNIDGFPAESLRLRWHGIFKIQATNDDTPKRIHKKRNDKTLWKEKKLVELIGQYTADLGNTFSKCLVQTIFFEQNKRYIEDFFSDNYSEITGRYLREIELATDTFDSGADYMIMTANMSETNKKLALKKKNFVPLIGMTSVANRGVSFEFLKHIVCDIPMFSVENNLMEIVQLAYRMRGDFTHPVTKTRGTYEKDDKTMDFVCSDNVYVPIDELKMLSEDERRRRMDEIAYEKTVHMLSMMTLVYGALLTRINGFVGIGDGAYTIIPVGQALVGKNFQNMCSVLHSCIQNLNDMKKDDYRAELLRTDIVEISRGLGSLAENGFKVKEQKTALPETVDSSHYKYLVDQKSNSALFGKIQSLLAESFLDFINNAPMFEVEAVIGNCFVSKIASVENTLEISASSMREKFLKNSPFIERVIDDKEKERRRELKTALKEFRDMMWMAEMDSHHFFESLKNESDDLYLMIPYPVLVHGGLEEEWNKHEEIVETETEWTATEAIKLLTKSVFPSTDNNSLLPFVHANSGVPYVVFSCPGMEHYKKAVFENRVSNSAGLNVLSIILNSQEAKSQ